MQFAHNWDNIGLRLTESGGVRIDNIRVPWSDALGWDATTKRPLTDVLGIPFATLLLPTIQLVFSNFYLGIAQGALDAAASEATTKIVLPKSGTSSNATAVGTRNFLQQTPCSIVSDQRSLPSTARVVSTVPRSCLTS
jgi:alkylation response protein AidB-like acyl-CoA dehydrogenase